MSIQIRVEKSDALKLEKIHENKSAALKMLFQEYEDTKRRNRELQIMMDILESIEIKINSISESVIPKLIEGEI